MKDAARFLRKITLQTIQAFPSAAFIATVKHDMKHTPVERKRKQLIFRSWHRGTKEMDLLLGTFADGYLPHFSEKELHQYDAILKESDPDLYSWIMGTATPPAHIVTPVLKQVIKHRYAE
jgi:antitoxin CptB